MVNKDKSVEFDVQWKKIFSELCYEVFYKNKKGAELLNHLEAKFFRSPVAFPNREPAWAYFNEGQNEMLRSFTAAIQNHMNQPIKTAKVKAIKRSKK